MNKENRFETGLPFVLDMDNNIVLGPKRVYNYRKLMIIAIVAEAISIVSIMLVGSKVISVNELIDPMLMLLLMLVFVKGAQYRSTAAKAKAIHENRKIEYEKARTLAESKAEKKNKKGKNSRNVK